MASNLPRIFTATADIVKEQMDKGLLDIGLFLEPVDMEKYDFIRLNMKENWVVLMQPDDPLAEKEYVTAEDLQSLPLILPRRMNVQSMLAWKRSQPFRLAATKFINHMKCFLSMSMHKN